MILPNLHSDGSITTKRPTLLLWLVIPLTILFGVSSYLFDKTEPDAIQASNAVQASSLLIEKHSESSDSGVITFWFDDAWKSQYTEGYTLLQEYGYKAALAVPVSHIGFKHYMNWYQVVDVQNNGWEIVSHGMSHNCDPWNSSLEELRYEIGFSQRALASHNLNKNIFVAPCGNFSDQSAEVIKEYYNSSRSAELGLETIPPEDNYNIRTWVAGLDFNLLNFSKLLEKAIKDKLWLNITFHQIDRNGDQYSITPEQLKSILILVNRSGLPVLLPSQIV